MFVMKAHLLYRYVVESDIIRGYARYSTIHSLGIVYSHMSILTEKGP